MKKRILSLILTLCMTLTLLPTTALAATVGGLTVTTAALGTPAENQVSVTLGLTAADYNETWGSGYTYYYRISDTAPAAPEAGAEITPAAWVEYYSPNDPTRAVDTPITITMADGQYLEVAGVVSGSTEIVLWGASGAVDDGFSAVAKIGNTGYEMLQDALDVGGTVELCADVAGESLQVFADKTVTLDLNGFDITPPDGADVFSIMGALTIQDTSRTPGTISGAITVSGSLTIKGGNYADGSLANIDEGTISLQGGTYEYDIIYSNYVRGSYVASTTDYGWEVYEGFNYTFGTITPDGGDDALLIVVYDPDGNVKDNAYADSDGKRVVNNLDASKTYTYTIDMGGYETYRGTITSSQTQGEDITLTEIDSDVTYAVSDNVLTISGSGPILDYATWKHAPWSGATGVSSVVINSGITRIGDRALAFGGFTAGNTITSISIPETVTSIGDIALGFNASLTAVEIPASVTSIESAAFDSCTSLTTITFAGNAPTLAEDVFYRTTGLTVCYPAGDASWDSVKDQNYDSDGNVTWLSYQAGGAEAASGLTVTTTPLSAPAEGKVNLSVSGDGGYYSIYYRVVSSIPTAPAVGISLGSYDGWTAYFDAYANPTEVPPASITISVVDGRYVEVVAMDITAPVVRLWGVSSATNDGYTAPAPSYDSSDNDDDTTTTTERNEDGSMTTTTTDNSTGAVTEVTRNTDGSRTTVVTEKDGTVTTTERAADGSTVKTVEDEDGNVTAEAAVSKDAGEALVENAVETGSAEIVIAPEINEDAAKTEVSVPEDTMNAISEETEAALTISTPVAAVTIPSGGVSSLADEGGAVTVSAERTGNEVTLEITAGRKAVVEVEGGITLTVPYEKATPGTVAVLVNEDGSREVIRKSVAVDGAVSVPLNGSATVEFVDNSKEFSDVQDGMWYSDAVDFVSARGLFSGTTETTFSLDTAMSRGMLAVVLHNLESNPGHAYAGGFGDVADGAWYQEAILWAAENGIMSGYVNGNSGAEDSISREQLAVMLWRYAGSPESNHRLTHFNDAGQISAYAQAALAWANENGIISGKGGGILDPKGNTTRAQVAVMLTSYCTIVGVE